MADIQILGGNTDTRSQIKNLWASVNKISNFLNTIGSGNVIYSDNGEPAIVGQHYAISSTDGLNCVKSDIIENAGVISFSNDDLTSINNLTSNKFIVSGGTNQQYLLANGDMLQQSAVSGNSNFYLFNNHLGSMDPPPNAGEIGYNTVDQNMATMIYISHLTRDNIDIEVFYNQITELNDIYIQDQNNSTNYIKYNINGVPMVIANSYIAIPVMISEGNGTGMTSFGDGHNIMVSFFSNLLEIDTRMSNSETKLQNQSAVSETTTFLGDVISDAFKISGQTGFLKANGNIDNNTYLTTANASSTYQLLSGMAAYQ